MKLDRKRVLSRSATVAAFALAVGLVGARPFTPGVSYKLRMVMNMPQMPGMPPGDMIIVGHGVAANGKSRLDIDSGGGGQMAPFGPGDYLLNLDSGRVVVVSPATKSYVDGFSMGGTIPPEIMAQASLSGVVVNVEKMGAGDTIEGRPTQKYKMTSQYTMNIMGQTIGFGGETELMTADLPANIHSPFSGGLPKNMANGPFAELYTKMLEAQKQVPGTALRVKNVTTITGPMNVNMSQNMQLVDVKSTDVDEKQLQIPEGYTVRPPGL
jgi:hypothetical protein